MARDEAAKASPTNCCFDEDEFSIVPLTSASVGFYDVRVILCYGSAIFWKTVFRGDTRFFEELNPIPELPLAWATLDDS